MNIGLAIAGACVLLWISVCALSSKVGTWSKLQNKYPTLGMPTGTTYHFQSATIGKVSYNNALHIQVSSRGLYMIPMIPFRFGHSPILIPWREIHAEERKGFFGTSTVLSVGRPQITTLGFGNGFMERSNMKRYLQQEKSDRLTTAF
ncbi:hypothetical protein CO157_01540 [Candidatus Peregrinibacteria bacterium CG_4_9_14_3_um_filter_49_12]|nr:MAG: hypothetical protein COV83_06465 [Candidatus Peregrinibacteria bacterium CG11_big_fil_rev_8_21_14_0_20_49_14]PJA67989.1 MAG: hypothetical protein CO157_01540 [Candidatus Peregrinibacteria bacterium CG_4_9_14_3_um_filter_49_12]